MIRSWSVVVIASTLFAALGPAQAATAATPLSPDTVLTVPGHGWGHGRGLGQWGARGYAEQGKTYAQILASYYSGTTLGSRDTSEEIRVLVETSPDVLVTSDAPFTAVMGGRTVATSSSSLPFLRARWDGSAYVLERAASHTGSWARVTSSASYPIFRPGTAKLELVFASGAVRVYRGEIHTRAFGSDIRAINELPIQSYLYGVVPAEMPSSWPTEALRAQAVAARTYAIYKKVASRANGTVFDICATTSCQVYSGYGSASSPSGTVSTYERSATNSAIDATAGRVVLYQGAPILAEFSSSTGGHSAPGSVAYQKAVPDLGDAISPHHDWQAQITVAEVEARWPQIGRLTNVQVTQRDGYGEWGGRVLRMRLDGTASSLEISGGAWRTAFAWPGRTNGVRGTYFTVLLHTGAVASVPEHVVVERGSSSLADVEVRNAGSADWPLAGEIMVGTTAPSPLANGQWISTTRAARIERNLSRSGADAVAPGEIARFRIPLTGGTATTLTEHFALFDGSNEIGSPFDLTVQYVDPWLDEAPNMLRSGSFDDGIAPWVMSGAQRGDGTVAIAPRDGSRALRLLGGGVKRATQRIALAGGRGRTFTFGGWNRTLGTTGSGGAIDLIGAVRYTDGSVTVVSVPFTRVPHAWVYDERTFTSDARKIVASVELVARSVEQTGTVYFDALRLLESPVPNASFEDGLKRWSRAGFVSGDGATAAAGRDGSRSLVLSGAPGEKSLTQSFDMIGRRTERVALSFWHHAQGLNVSGGAATVRFAMRATTGDESSVTVAIPKADHPWTYSETIVRIPWEMASADVIVTLTDQQGQLFVDALRLSRTFTTDPSFESASDDWVPYGDNDGVIAADLTRAREAASGAQLIGGRGRRGISQRVALSSGPGALFYLQGWSRSTNISATGGMAGYIVVFRNTDGTTTNLAFPVSAGTAPWTFMEVPVRSTKRFARIDLYGQLNDRSGVVAYDAIRLVRA